MSRQERETTERVTSTGGIPPEAASRTGTVTEVRETSSTTRNPVTWEEMRTLMQGAPARVPARTWRPTAGGVLAMVAGFWNIIVGAGILLGSFVLDIVSPSFLWGYGTFALTGTAAGIALVVLGVISVIGGYSAVRRGSWMLALIGGIASLVPSPVIMPFVLGVFSIIFIAFGKREFEERVDTTR